MLEIRFGMLKLLATISMLLLSVYVKAGTTACTSIASGNWSDVNTWNCNTGSGVPRTDSRVSVVSPHTVVLDVDASVVSIIVDSGADLDVAASAGGLTLSWTSSLSDISAANIDLLGDLTINALTGAPIDLLMGSVDGPFNLNLNAEGNTQINGPIGDVTPLASLDTDQDGSITIANSITTTLGQFIDDDAVIIAGDVTLSGEVNLRGAVDADMIAADRNLTIDSSVGVQMNSEVGGAIALNSLLVQNATRVTLESDVTTTEAQTYNSDVVIRTATHLTGSEVNFNGNVISESVTANGFDLTVTGDANFTSDIGTLTPAAFGFVNLNSLSVVGNTDITVAGDADFITGGGQSFDGALTLGASTIFSSLESGDIVFYEGILAAGQHVTINTAGTTRITSRVFGADFLIEAASLTTDAAGLTWVSFKADFQMTSDDTATTFNDTLQLGPSTEITITQNGAADTVFNNNVVLFSGGPKILTVNDVSGQTIFNGDINIGQLNTNDGSGDDLTVINTASIRTNRGGSNNGVMTFNDPVRLMQDVTFSENNNGQIIFNNTLDEADGVPGVDITINSGSEVILGPVGTVNSVNSLVTDADGSTTLNGNVIGNTPFIFNDTVTLNQSVRISGEDVNFNSAVDLQTFDLRINALESTMAGVVSGSGGLISDVFDNINLAAENTYTGQTIINRGNLNLRNAPSVNSISESSEIILGEDASLLPNAFTLNFDLADGQTLSGEGRVSNSMTGASGSVISPGSSPGELQFDDLSMSTGSSYHVEIEGFIPGIEHDQLSAGQVNLDEFMTGGATLIVDLNSDIQLNDQLVIIDQLGPFSVNGTFNGLPEGASLTATNGSIFNISYVGGDGNDVVLSGACSSAITVTDGADSGAGTLREAVKDLCPGGQINFTDDLIVSLSDEILINKQVFIDGSGHNVELTGNGSNRVFNNSVSGDLTLVMLTIKDGFSDQRGGAIFNQGALYIEDSLFDGNISGDSNVSGGAIFNGGGATLNITSSTFTNNLGNRGGAIYNGQDGSDGVLTITNSTFTQNGSNAFEGGAIHSRGMLVSNNSTFAANGGAGTNGGGLFTWNGDLILNNTIVADSLGGNDCFIETSNSTQSNTNSLIEIGNCTAALTDDPQLIALANNGGNTQTMAISLQSPAVDAGSNVVCTVEDQRGVNRPQLNACDIGAYETEFLGIIYVAGNVPNRGGACILGGCWGNAFSSLQDALAVAGPGSEVWVQAGRYLPDVGAGLIDDNPTQSFNVTQGVAVYGGFVGNESARDQRDFNTNITILSGDIDENDVNDDVNNIAETEADIAGTNANHVLTTSGDGVIVDGFTITAGQANGKANDERRGGGISCHLGSSLNSSFINNIWSANRADNEAGAMYGCNGAVIDSMFISNISDGSVGAIRFTSSSVLENVSFISNSAAFFAGAIQAVDISIDRGLFSGNQASAGEGGAILSTGNAVIDNSLFIGNFSATDGGALFLINTNELVNVTFTGNVAAQTGGAVFYLAPPPGSEQFGGPLSFYNSIIWNNQDSSGAGTITAGIASIGSAAFVSHSLYQGSGGSTSWNPAAGVDGGNNIDLDPDFVQDVDLMSVPTIGGDAHVILSSATIGSGNNQLVDTTLDLDGNDRVFGSDVDMGAYEYIDLIFKNGFDEPN